MSIVSASVTDINFSWNFIAVDTTIKIPLYQQMIVKGRLSVHGRLTILGRLSII